MLGFSNIADFSNTLTLECFGLFMLFQFSQYFCHLGHCKIFLEQLIFVLLIHSHNLLHQHCQFIHIFSFHICSLHQHLKIPPLDFFQLCFTRLFNLFLLSFHVCDCIDQITFGCQCSTQLTSQVKLLFILGM